MRVWLVFGAAKNDPNQKSYILGAHSSQDAAQKQRDEGEAVYAAHVIDVEVDGAQPPVLIDVDTAHTMGSCVGDSIGDQS